VTTAHEGMWLLNSYAVIPTPAKRREASPEWYGLCLPLTQKSSTEPMPFDCERPTKRLQWMAGAAH